MVATGALAVSAFAGCHRAGSGIHIQAEPSGRDGTPVTFSLQGGATPTCEDPLTRASYDVYRAAFANGPDKVDLPAFEHQERASIRAYVASQGWPPGDADRLIDHLKDIPRQFVEIVKDDPKVLDSCEAFSLAMSGPP